MIQRAPLAGGGPVDTFYGPSQGVTYPVGVAIDPAAGRIYWGSGLAKVQGARSSAAGPSIPSMTIRRG